MTYNLWYYCLADRDGDGQKNDPKPAPERQAIQDLIARTKPDVLALQEMGQPQVWEEFKYDLKRAGLDYPFEEYLARGKGEINMAVLSRFPIIARQPHVDDVYSIGPAQVPVSRGFIEVDLEVNPQYRFRLLVAHLKSKVFHSLGQTEMRRNEARLLNNHVRRALKEDPLMNVLVVGDLNDDPNSAAIREVMGVRKQKVLFDLRPADATGQVWTRFSQEDDIYTRIDYIMANASMFPEIVREKCRVLSDPQVAIGSDHRPILAVIKAHECEIPADLDALSAPPPAPMLAD